MSYLVQLQNLVVSEIITSITLRTTVTVLTKNNNNYYYCYYYYCYYYVITLRTEHEGPTLLITKFATGHGHEPVPYTSHFTTCSRKINLKWKQADKLTLAFINVFLGFPGDFPKKRLPENLSRV